MYLFKYKVLSLLEKKFMIFVHRKIALYLARVWRLFANFTRLFEKETFAYHRTSLLNKKLCITLRLFAMFCYIAKIMRFAKD